MRKRRGAIIGYGFISERGHGPAYQGNAEWDIVAAADICGARRERLAQTFPGIHLYDDFRALLSAEAGNLDFVDITTPPHMHAPIALAALEAGLHVFCEKPMAVHPDEARAMLAMAERKKRVLLPVMNYKHAPVIRAVRRAIDAGQIGSVRQVTLTTFRNTHARGVDDWNPDWRRQRRYSGGGIAMDHGSHTFYLAFDWLGSYPKTISARMSHLGRADTEDTFSATATFPTGMATMHLTWTAGVRKVIYTIHGDKGAIRVEDDDIEITTHAGHSGVVAPGDWRVTTESVPSDWMDASHVNWFSSLLDQFGRQIDARDYVGKDAIDALRCVELIDAAYLSARRGCKDVTLGEVQQDDRLCELN